MTQCSSRQRHLKTFFYLHPVVNLNWHSVLLGSAYPFLRKLPYPGKESLSLVCAKDNLLMHTSVILVQGTAVLKTCPCVVSHHHQVVSPCTARTDPNMTCIQNTYTPYRALFLVLHLKDLFPTPRGSCEHHCIPSCACRWKR